MASKIEYNVDLLNNFCKEYNLNILENFKNTKVNCNVKLTSKCINKDCNDFFYKKFHILYKTKVFTCKKCTWIDGDKKHKQTLLNKYGTENIWDVEEIKEKKILTCLNKYGVNNVAQNLEIMNKIKQTKINKILPSPIIDKENPIFCTEDAKLCEDGTSVSRDPLRNCEFPPCSEDYETCQEEWDNANNDFNQKKYYVFALIGFALLLVGLFSKEILVQITGLATGGILVAEGIVTNFQNKVVTFISLFLILVVFGILAYRIVNRD